MSDRTEGAGVIRLALNVPAVERLLAGDQELEIALRHQVKEQIFTNHLGAMMNDPAITQMVDQIKQNIDETFRQECAKQIGSLKTSYYSKEQFDLGREFKLKLDETVRKLLEPFVRSLIEEHARRITGEWLAMADVSIQNKMDQGIEKAINDGIAKRLAAAATAK